MNKNKLLNELIDHTTKEGEYTQIGDYKNVNKEHNEIIKVIKRIYLIDQEFELLEILLTHQNESVRKWAASILLFSNKKAEARKVLKKISEGKGLASFTAQMTLSEFDKGALTPFYELNID